MNRIRAITTLKDSVGPTAVDAAIEAIRDYRERWGLTAEPEEDALTREILGTLIDLQVRSVERSVRLGEAMSRRLTTANDADPTTPDTDPSGSALAAPVSMGAAA
mgnify:CR=1 FL=1